MFLFGQKYDEESENKKLWGFWEGFSRRYFKGLAATLEPFANFSKECAQVMAHQSFKNKKTTHLPLAFLSYVLDAGQKTFLFYNCLRQRGNTYIETIQRGVPPVLEFDYKVLMDGRKLANPVNYALAQILPPKDVVVDPKKRPFMIIDPRAGHISGIGGFKESSQVGVGLQDGHAIYFVIFYPVPVPDQRLADVMNAEIIFLEEIRKRHPKAPKPCIVGNCQGGWAAMCMVAARNDLSGPVLLNGAPLSYWAGEDGKNPMRYLGGLSGGRWLALFLSDLGNGLFDGANLVANFEYLNPANTFFTKYYHLYNQIDTEETRFLKFERWWGSYALMNKNEINTILDDLFIGNKLSNGKIILDGGRTLDLRAVKQPIFVFCSQNDNISPPHQSLQWIKDIHKDERSLRLSGQVIIYMVHKSIGHLGLFVSGQIAQREYKEMTHALETMEALPPGLYEMRIEPKNQHNTSYKKGGGDEKNYEVIIQRRKIKDLLSDFHPEDDEKKFSLVKMLSDFYALGYTIFFSPNIQKVSNQLSGEIFRQAHYLRWQRLIWSDMNPCLSFLSPLAHFIHQHRYRLEEDNIFSQYEKIGAAWVRYTWDVYRNRRDHWVEMIFHYLYGILDLAHIQPMDKQGFSLPLALAQVRKIPLEDQDFYDTVLGVLLLLCEKKKDFKREEIDTLTERVRQFYGKRQDINQENMRRKLKKQALFLATEGKEGLMKAIIHFVSKHKKEKKQMVHFIENMPLLDYPSVRRLWKDMKDKFEQ